MTNPKNGNGPFSISPVMPMLIQPNNLMSSPQKMKISSHPSKGRVVIEFEKEISWLELSKADAIQFVQTLAKHVNELPG